MIGTYVYYHLNHLKENKLITSKSKVVFGTNVIEKIYKVNQKFYGKGKTDLRPKIRDSPKKMHDAILFQLYLTVFAVGRQIVEISNMSNAEIKNQIDNKTLPFSRLFFCNAQDLQQATDIFTDTIRSLDSIREGKDQTEYKKNRLWDYSWVSLNVQPNYLFFSSKFANFYKSFHKTLMKRSMV